jgi:tight adherence protein B
MTAYLLYFSVFVVVALLTSLVGAQMATGAARASTMNRRLQVLERAGDGFSGLVDIRRERGLGQDGTLGTAFQSLGKLYLQSGVTVGWQRILLVAAIGAIAVGALVAFVSGMRDIGILVGVIIFAAGPYLYLSHRRTQRLKKFSQQLADAIDVITRSLHAGHPLSASLSMVASEMPDPIGSEFGILNDELTYGTSMETALNNLILRVPVDDLAMFAMSVVIQRQTGGNLAEILETLAATVRDRHMLRQKVKSLTAEGRFSAVFLTAFPALMFLLIKAMSPDYFDPLWESGYGGIVVAVCIAGIIVGNLIMRRMINFKV